MLAIPQNKLPAAAEQREETRPLLLRENEQAFIADSTICAAATLAYIKC